MQTCPYCKKAILQPSVIWTNEGLAHYQCWYEKVIRIPVAKEKITYNPSSIYEQYYDAATGQKLHPKQVINRINKRWFYTFCFDQNYKFPSLK